MHPIGFLGGAAAVLAIAMFCTIYTFGTIVSYRGDVLGTVSNKEAVANAVSEIEKAAQENFNSNYNICK